MKPLEDFSTGQTSGSQSECEVCCFFSNVVRYGPLKKFLENFKDTIKSEVQGTSIFFSLVDAPTTPKLTIPRASVQLDASDTILSLDGVEFPFPDFFSIEDLKVTSEHNPGSNEVHQKKN